MGMNNTDAAIVRCYIPTESRHYNGPDERTVVEWSEYPPEMMPPHFTQEKWDEAGGPDCLKNEAVVVKPEDAERIAKEKAKLPNNYGGIAMIYRQRLDVYARDRGIDLGHWEAMGEGEEVTV